MKAKTARTGRLFLASTQRTIAQQNLPRIVKCLQQLSEEEIWWRPNSASNSAGNLVLHLCGNVRQWIISGLGGAKDMRKRDLEFSEQGPIPRKALVIQLRQTVREASRILSRLSDESLTRNYEIQGYRVTGLDAVFRAAEHFGFHTGQIVYITKLKCAQDLKFTQLPVTKPVVKKHGTQ